MKRVSELRVDASLRDIPPLKSSLKLAEVELMYKVKLSVDASLKL